MKTTKFLLTILCLSLTTVAFAQHDFTDESVYWQSDSINFDVPYQYIKIDTSENNIWQIGVPQKDFLSNTLHGSKSIMTDTINNYPVNNHSFVELRVGENLDFGIAMTHKYDTDLFGDGCYITVSYDDSTWTNIIFDENSVSDVTPNSFMGRDNLYTAEDLLSNGECGFSGNSEDWVFTWFGWFEIARKDRPLYIDSLKVRFNFISDNIDNEHEGWQIDMLYFFGLDFGGSVNDLNEAKFRISPNPIQDFTIIELEKFYTSLKIELLSLDGHLIRTENFYNTQNIRFTPENIESGMYVLKVTSDKIPLGAKLVLIK